MFYNNICLKTKHYTFSLLLITIIEDTKITSESRECFTIAIKDIIKSVTHVHYKFYNNVYN